MSFLSQYLPRRLLSRIFGDLASIHWPFGLNAAVNAVFAFLYGINLSEAEKSVADYPSLVDFFTRKLKDGSRPIDNHQVVHPCDAEIVQQGKIDGRMLVQAKGINYPVDILTRDPSILDRFENGYFVTYYLSPRDYHRFHSPVEGVITHAIYSEGDLWPVDSWARNHVDGVYLKNERVYVEIASAEGPIGMVFVGAMNVGSIVLNFETQIKTNQMQASKTYKYAQQIPINKGQEMGQFRMGSTIVVLYSSVYASHIEDMNFNRRYVKIGQGFIH